MMRRRFNVVTFLLPAVFVFCGLPQAKASLMLTWFPSTSFNSNTTVMDATLGTTGFIVDGFETTTLIPGLSITLSGSVPTQTWTALPTVFNPNTQGDGFEANNQWDGTDVMNNGTNNQLFGNPWASLTTFNLPAGARSFGIGLSSFQSPNPPLFAITNHELFINGVDMGMIETLAGANFSPGTVRNAYLRVDASGDSAINSVGFEYLPSSNGPDFLIFDHLAVSVNTPEPATFGLLLIGAAVGASRWRRRR